MKNKKLLFILGFIAQVTLSLNIAYANPAYFSAQIIPCSATSDSEIAPRANVTGYQYMEINGVLYKRLWSYTYGRWEDPYWTKA